MSEAAPLLPCPFCGSSHVDLHRGQIVGTRDNGMRFVRCLNCGASTSYRQKEDAIKTWNERYCCRQKEDAIKTWNERYCYQCMCPQGARGCPHK